MDAVWSVGTTGRLIAEEAVRRGHSPLLAGRDAVKLRELQRSTGNNGGQRVAAMLETGEGYRTAAAAAVGAVERLIATPRYGALTPAQAFGDDFALSVPGTRLQELSR